MGLFDVIQSVAGVIGNIVQDKYEELEKKREKILRYIEIHENENEYQLKCNYRNTYGEEKIAIKELLKRKFGYSEEDF